MRILLVFVSLSIISTQLSAQKTTITVNGTTYQLDGTNPSKWVTILKSTDPAIIAKSFRRDANSSNDDQWTGGSQDPDLVNDWYWVKGSTNDKGDISNAGVIMLGKTIYFFGDRTSTSGSAQIAFWFFLGGIAQNDIKGKGGFRWDGTNQEGDILGISNFINGGGTPQLTVYKRQANGSLLPNGGTTHLAVNLGLETAPNTTADADWPFADDWTFTPKSGANQTYPSPLFFEGSIDFTNAADAKLCFTNFLLETRNSHELGASLQDFVTGKFNVSPEKPTPIPDVKCLGEDLLFKASCTTGGSSPRWYATATSTTPLGAADGVSPDGVLTVKGLGVGEHTRYASCYNAILGCESGRVAVTGKINPLPPVDAVSDRTHCHGESGALIKFSSSVTGATFAWTSTIDVGFGLSGNGDIPAYTAKNTTTAPITATVTVKATANNCLGPERTFKVTVNPLPSTNTIGDRTHCHGEAGAIIDFTSPVSGATFAWTSSHDVGFGLSGNGDIPAYTAKNTTTAPITATVTVKATAATCEGPAMTFKVTVNPLPSTNTIGDRTHCHGEAGSLIDFTSPVSGATFVWTSTIDVGFGLTGNGDIPGYTAKNTGSAPVTATITVKAKANNCEGPAMTFKVTVNHTPKAPFVKYNPPNCDEATFSVTLGSLDNPVLKDATYTITDKNGANIPNVKPGNSVKATADGQVIEFSNIPAGSGYKITTTLNGCVSGSEDCKALAPITKAAAPPSEQQDATVESTYASKSLDIAARIDGVARVLAAPNPFADRVKFTLESVVSGQGSLELYNMVGQKIHTVYQGYVEAGKPLVKEYAVPKAGRTNLIYVFRVGNQKVTGKLLNW